MGMYDSVVVDCPNCGRRIIFQTKAGLCELRHYRANEGLPLVVAEDLHHTSKECPNCKKHVGLQIVEPRTWVDMEAICGNFETEGEHEGKKG